MGVFGDFAHVAITVDDDVDAQITLRLRHAPWDFALDHIAHKYALRVIREGDRIRIARQ
jgi:hypothetical protein